MAGRSEPRAVGDHRALQAIVDKVKALCREVGTNQPPDTLLLRLNPVCRWQIVWSKG